MSKRPKVRVNPLGAKTPRQEFPTISLVKDHYASWQFNKIDMDGKWGLLKAVNEFSFDFNDEVIESLPGTTGNDVYKCLTELSGRKFKSLDDLLAKLSQYSNNKISPEEQKTIIKVISESIFWTEVMPKLKLFEGNTWHEIETQQYGKHGKTKHHFIEVSKICSDAKKRLQELKLDDIDELFSMRLAGEFRIWGIRQLGYLQILWIDPEHEVYPV